MRFIKKCGRADDCHQKHYQLTDSESDSGRSLLTDQQLSHHDDTDDE